MAGRLEDALCFLDDVELGQGALPERTHVIREGGRKTSGTEFTQLSSSPSVFPLPSLFNLDYCPKMRPTAVVRGDAPSGTFGPEAYEFLADPGTFTGKAWVRSGAHHQRELFLIQVSRSLEPLVGC